MVQSVKNPPAIQETQVRSLGWDNPLEKGVAGYPLQYSCLKNPMDRGAWRATVCRVTKSQTRLKRLSMRARTQLHAEESKT